MIVENFAVSNVGRLKSNKVHLVTNLLRIRGYGVKLIYSSAGAYKLDALEFILRVTNFFI
jgi:hypothetical protein